MAVARHPVARIAPPAPTIISASRAREGREIGQHDGGAFFTTDRHSLGPSQNDGQSLFVELISMRNSQRCVNAQKGASLEIQDQENLVGCAATGDDPTV